MLKNEELAKLLSLKVAPEKLKRLPHKYAHNRRYFELKSRLWNLFRNHMEEESVCMVIDAVDKQPDQVKIIIESLKLPEPVTKSYLRYVDLIVELGGIVV